MDTSGIYPVLGGDDPLFEISDYTTALEAKFMNFQRMEFRSTNFSAVAGGTNIGPLTKFTADVRAFHGNSDCATAVGQASGAIKILEEGFYVMSVFVIPTGGPGNTWVAINRSRDNVKLAQGGNTPGMWECQAHIVVPTWFEANDIVTAPYSSGVTHNIDSRFMIHKVWG